MSSVLDRSSLEQSPLADLHLLADELGVDGYRRLRKDDLVDALVARQSGEEPAGLAEAELDAEPELDAQPEMDAEPEAREADESSGRGRRSRRGGRGRARGRDDDGDRDRDRDRDEADAPAPRSRSRSRSRDADDGADAGPAPADTVVEGVVELIANGSGFVRLSPPDPTDEDVYVSAAQVKRCELVSGDRVGGPVRTPRRSERFPSMIRIDTINGRPADEVAEGTRFEDLPVAFPEEHLELGSEDPTVKAMEWLTPFGKGSRVSIVGDARSGKSEALRRLAGALAAREGLELAVVLAGVRPEEAAEWQQGPAVPTAALSFAASADAQAQVVEQAVEQGRRVAARGGDAVVLIDSLEYLTPGAARRALAAARNIVDGGSLTVIATSSVPLGGETTVVALDAALAAQGRFPAIDLTRSGTLRPERLVGEAGAEALAKARLEAAGQA